MVNVREGFRRLNVAFVGLVWIAALALLAYDIYQGHGVSHAAQVIGGLFVFTLCWALLSAGVAWIARGFTNNSR